MAKKCESRKVEDDNTNTISVDVLEDGEGFILVSYSKGSRNFQGVLVDVNRSGLPCGVKPPAWYSTECPGSSGQTPDDPYHTISTRMTYFQSSYDLSQAAGRGAAAAPASRRHHHRHRGGRTTVRLRPRQVLCSNCKSICSESSENVQQAAMARSRRGAGGADENADPAGPPQLGPPLGTVPAPAAAAADSPPPLKLPRIPIVRLSAQQLRVTGPPGGAAAASSSSSSLSSSTSSSSSPAPSPPPPPPHKLTVSPIKIVGTAVTKCDAPPLPLPLPPPAAKPKLQKIKISGGAIVPSLQEEEVEPGRPPPDRRAGLRKRRLAVGSMENLWDESVLVDGNRTNSSEQEDTALTPVLKITFGGREGAGTVLKIPAKYKLQARTVAEPGPPALAPPEADPEPERLLPAQPTASAKAARRALKKARKDVQRKLVGSPRASPAYHWGARSPACPRASPNYPQMSPAYYRVASAAVGLPLSPAHPEPPAPPPPAASPLRKKRHKHKLKHKRRRRDRERQAPDGDAPPAASVEVRPRIGVEMKERCLSQKLSISLRRVRASEYAADGAPDGGADGEEASPPAAAHQVPPFPDVRLPESADVQPASCALQDGRVLHVHDIVWGKIHGFPWWPGKVMCISGLSASCQEAYVSWYGSTTSSLMRCSQLLPFLDTFETRVNRKRRGPYREAVRQATQEAQSARPPPPTTPTPPPAPQQTAQQPPLALAGSPREVDVAS